MIGGIPAAKATEIICPNLKLVSSFQRSSQGFDATSSGSSNNLGELWTSSGDSCSNTGVLVTAKFFPSQSAGGQMVWGYYKDDTASIRPVRRVVV